MVFFWTIVAIIIFSLVVLIHELWHFSAARKFWVKVEEFWLWIPPRAKKLFTDKKWTLYSLNWLPLWGFVKLKWENLESLKNKNDKEALINKPAWQQSIIILAWVFMNFLLASVIFSILFFTWLKPIWVNTQIPTNLELKLIPTYSQAIDSGLLIKEKWVILEPIKWSIAEKSWLKKWDILLKVNNISIKNPKEVINIVSSNKDKEVIFKIKRNNEYKTIKLIVWKNWKIWSYLWDNIIINKNFEYKYWLLESIKYWFLETYNQSLLTIKWLWILWKKIFNPQKPEERTQALNQMSWPIWIVDFISNSLENWFIFLLIITAIISINLWVFNLLPIPALDWWRFIFIVINWIILKIFWKKFINQNTENLIHISFFILLIVLSLLIWYNDVNKIISR
jgi:regulator of sigma E protease